MGDELMARADGGDETLQAGSAGASDSAGANAGEQWRRGFLDPENWHPTQRLTGTAAASDGR